MNRWARKVLHLGLGRFHRAHQAAYLQRLADLGGSHWGVAAFSMRSPGARDQLRRVEGRYPVLELGSADEHLRWIEVHTDLGDAQEDQELLWSCFTDPTVEVVTLTITEKGYAADSAAIRWLCQGLSKRQASHAGPMTVISCDNLRSNGRRLRELVTAHAEAPDAHWLSSSVRFPCSMVDRIVPALSEERTRELEAKHRLSQSELVATELFSQWVIEDSFAGPRPDWNKAGVEFVKDVTPFEEMKLRLLNASHSYLAYLGLLKGHEFVHQAIRDCELRAGVIALQREVAPFLEGGIDYDAYRELMLRRFENDQLPHRLIQIAMDGTQKLPQRIFSSLELALAKRGAHQELDRCVRGWYEFVAKNVASKLDDPKAQELAALWEQGQQAQLFEQPIFAGTLSPSLKAHLSRVISSPR